MPVVSPSRYSTASNNSLSNSLSSGSYRSTLSSSSSLDRPYYSSASGSYITPRTSSLRSAYSDRTSNSVTEYRTHSRLTYDGDRKMSTYSSEYSRYVPNATSDSDSGISGVSRFASRSGSRSRDTSVTRSESSKSSRSDPLPRSFLEMSTADFCNKYSPANYIPRAQRLSTAVTGPNGESNNKAIKALTSRPPTSARRLSRDEVNTANPPDVLIRPIKRLHDITTNSTLVNKCVSQCDTGNTNMHSERLVPQRCSSTASNPGASTTAKNIDYLAQRHKAQLSAANPRNSTYRKPNRLPDGYRDGSTVSDDNGNDLQLSVSEIRRKFDPKMTVTRLPARDTLYDSSSDNIYNRVRNLDSGVSSDGKYGSLRWEFLSPSPSPNLDSKTGSNSQAGYTIKHATDPGSDISTVYIAGKMTADRVPIDSIVKSQLQPDNAVGRILEKSTTVYVGNGDSKPTNVNREKEDFTKNVLNIEIGQNDKPEEEIPIKKTAANHTSDFASYIPISATNGIQSKLHNGSEADSGMSKYGSYSELSNNCTPELPSKYESPASTKSISCLLAVDECDGTKLRYIDSEPGSESDVRMFVDYNGKDDSSGEEGFENKTFEHENGHLLRKTNDTLVTEFTTPVDYKKMNGTMVNGFKDHEDEIEEECNGKSTSEDASGTVPETPLAKRRNEPAMTNGDLHYQNDSEASSSAPPAPPMPASPTCGSLSTSSSNNISGTIASRRRSIGDSCASNNRSPQGQEQLSKSSGLNGLRNIGNTCFMNSVVQCLSNTKPLMEYCGNLDQFSPDINTTLSCMKGALIKAFSTVISELWKAGESDGVVNTTALKAQIQRFAPRFMGYSQQDAQEFLRYLLEGLHEDVNRVTIKPKPILTEIDDNLSDAQKAQEAWQRYLRAEDSRVGDIFVGQLKSSLRCTHCSHTSVTFDPFWDLSLPIPSRTGQLKLTQCLSHFTKEEDLDGDEKPTCSKCQMRRKCVKWFTVQKFPRVLVIHLKRFSPTERFRGKLNVLVEFPLNGLDVTPYSATNQRAVYNLYAVSNHSGTTHSGHYTAYCKHPYNGEWHEYNDSRVSPIASKNVVSSEAYVLFYELSGPMQSS